MGNVCCRLLQNLLSLLLLSKKIYIKIGMLFVFLALQPCGCIFHSPVAGFSLLLLEVS